MNRPQATTQIATAKSRREFDVIRCGLFNECGGIEVYTLANQVQDTEFEYPVYLDRKLTKAKRAEVESFVRGIQCAFRSF